MQDVLGSLILSETVYKVLDMPDYRAVQVKGRGSGRGLCAECSHDSLRLSAAGPVPQLSKAGCCCLHACPVPSLVLCCT